jgi:hypothetical protein
VRLLTSGEDGRGWPESNGGGKSRRPARSSMHDDIPVVLRRRKKAPRMRLVVTELRGVLTCPEDRRGRRISSRRLGSAPRPAAAQQGRRRSCNRGRAARACGDLGGALYRGRAQGPTRGAHTRKEEAAACPPWTPPAHGLQQAQMGPARADGWAGADLGRAFGLGPLR